MRTRVTLTALAALLWTWCATAQQEAVTATRVPGEFIVRYVPGATPCGEIKPGARADLLLVSGNPLRSLETIRRPLGVMSAGRWRTQQQLDELLAGQKSRYKRVLQ